MEVEKNVLFKFINNISQFVWWKDADSIFLGCNENLAKYVGLDNSTEIVGKSDYEIFTNKEDADFVRKVDREIITTGKPQLNFEEHLELPNIGKRWLSTSKIPLYDDDRKIIGTLGWFSDITSVKEMKIQIDEKNKTLVQYSLQLKKANTELELINIDLEKFTYAASHDLKTPIRTMKSFADLLKMKAEDNLDPKLLEYIDFISDSSERMAKLVDGILLYARSGSKDIVFEHVDLQQIAQDKISNLQSVVDDKSAVVNLNLPSVKIKAHQELIGLVFYNLMSNGLKFNHSSSPIINCNYVEKDDFWLISVEDNGNGIEQEYQDQVFKPFSRLVGQEIEGSGLGLSICKRVTTLHNGDIWIEKSTPGHTVIQFTISKEL